MGSPRVARGQRQTDHELDEVQPAGPLTSTSTFQGSGRGPNTGFIKLKILVKFANVKYFTLGPVRSTAWGHLLSPLTACPSCCLMVIPMAPRMLGIPEEFTLAIHLFWIYIMRSH